MTLQGILKSYLEQNGESMRSLSLRAGLNAKAVSDILRGASMAPTHSTICALSEAIGQPLPKNDVAGPFTYADLIASIHRKVLDTPRARRLEQRLRWLLRAAGWVAEIKYVDRAEVIAFFARTNARTFGLTAGSFATYKFEALDAIAVALPRTRRRGIVDIAGPYKKLHRAISDSALPKSLQLVSGSFLVFLHDNKVDPGAVTQDTLEKYFYHRLAVSGTGQSTAKKHVKKVASLLDALANDPVFQHFGIANPGHPFDDGRDKYEVKDQVISAIMTEFDTRVGPWASGLRSRDGLDRSAFVAQLDAQRPTAAEGKKALLRNSGLNKQRHMEKTEHTTVLKARGFLVSKERWCAKTLRVRRGFLSAAAKALYARTGFLVETLDELTDPEVVWSIVEALMDANQTGFHSGYSESVVKTIIKIADGFLGRPEAEVAELKAIAATLKGRKDLSERNVAKLKAFTPDRIKDFLNLSNTLLRAVNSETERRRKLKRKARTSGTRSVKIMDVEQCRDVMCAVAHDIMLVRAPRSANVLGIRLDWIRWSGKCATIVLPGHEVKGRDKDDPDLPIDLGPEASELLRTYIEAIRPKALLPGDEENPYLFPRQNLKNFTPGQFYSGLLIRLTRRVFERVGVHINPHLYRHLIGWIWLREDIDMLPVVQKLLGHKNLKTTMDYYAAIDETLAMQKWQEFLNEKRAQR